MVFKPPGPGSIAEKLTFTVLWSNLDRCDSDLALIPSGRFLQSYKLLSSLVRPCTTTVGRRQNIILIRTIGQSESNLLGGNSAALSDSGAVIRFCR
jgi:hypothetical protein